MGRKNICNLSQIKELVDSKSIKKIEHFWNHKFQKISKKDLKGMLDAHKLSTEFLKYI